MNHVVTVQDAITAVACWDWLEPTDAELDAIERELPLIDEQVAELDAQIICMDRPLSELDARRLRRASNRVLDARRKLTNQAPAALSEVGA
ncbi:DUF6284 family protein [Streptomyces odontomachi]|uniref:DUF6284 family protein n=1 Tax=Streptomyces odontomachi TaxID=2944940 RepID=UPI002108D132|nr:DUF6284 family protein [Streptomyces sp. ODS25]